MKKACKFLFSHKSLIEVNDDDDAKNRKHFISVLALKI